MAAIDEVHDDVLATIPDGVPVVMVNLMKFRAASADGDGTGWDAYLRYSRQVHPLIKERGGAIVWSGDAAGASLGSRDHGDYDYVALVRYPSKDAFRSMIASPEYEAANHHRTNGCERHVIIATQQAYGRFRDD